MYNKKLILSNGVKIPQLGLGTQFIDDDKVADAVKAAADLGYRHFDTAQAYGNERGVGEGIRTCGIPREELFVVSKVAAEHKTYEDAKASIDKTLSDMGLDYLDMMIIHSPQPWVEVNQSDKALGLVPDRESHNSSCLPDRHSFFPPPGKQTKLIIQRVLQCLPLINTFFSYA